MYVSVWHLHGTNLNVFHSHSGTSFMGNALNENISLAIDHMHWRHVSITTQCWGSRLVALRAHVVLAERIGAQPLSQCAGPGPARQYGMQGWPSGCMLGDGAHGSATFDPQRAWAPFCDIICIRSIEQTQELSSFKGLFLDERVCGTETSILMPIPNSISLRCITECGLHRSNGEAHNSNFEWLPWSPSHVPLPVKPTLITFSKTAVGRNWGNSRYPRYAIWPRGGTCHANHACAALTVSRSCRLAFVFFIENVHRYYKNP